MTRALSAPVLKAEPYVLDRQPHWVSMLQEFVRLPSPFEAEMEMVAAVEHRLRAMGCSEVIRIVHDPAVLGSLAGAVPPISRKPGRHSLVAVLRGSGGGRSLTLNGHLDTATEGDPTAWARPPFSGAIDPATALIHGRGSLDDKAGVVICLAVAECVLRAPVRLKGDLVLQFVLEDEITGNGTLLCLHGGPRTDAALILDGTRRERAIVEHAGQLQCVVDVTGRPVSVGVSHLGLSAAEMLAELLLALKREIHGLNAARPEPWRCFPSPNQCSIQGLRCDAPIFTLPERATGQVYVTFCPPWTLAGMQRFVQEFAERFAVERDWPTRPRVSWGDYALDPVAPAAGGALAQLVSDCSIAVGGPPVRGGPSTGTSDLRHFAEAGVPCLLYGPGGGQNPHRADEHYELDDLPSMILFCLELAVRWCGVDDRA